MPVPDALIELKVKRKENGMLVSVLHTHAGRRPYRQCEPPLSNLRNAGARFLRPLSGTIFKSKMGLPKADAFSGAPEIPHRVSAAAPFSPITARWAG